MVFHETEINVKWNATEITTESHQLSKKQKFSVFKDSLLIYTKVCSQVASVT